jgi:hypothetical protein
MKPFRSSFFVLCIALFLAGLPSRALTSPVSKLYAAKNAVPSTEPGFGSAIALSDRWLAIAETGNDEVSTEGGAVHLFDASSGRHLRKLVPNDTPDTRLFGNALAIHGDLLIVGAYFDSESAPVSGAAYVFDLRSGRQLWKLKANDADNLDFFGTSVAVFNRRALVGAPLDDQFGNNSGATYVFDLDTGTQLYKLTASDAAAGHEFGYSVALSGSLALIGSPVADGMAIDSGAAYLFDLQSGAELQKITGSVAAANDGFGSAVALDGTLALIGAPNNDAVGLNGGMVYFFNAPTGTELSRLINAAFGGASEGFGARVALHGGLAIVGAPGANAFTGAAYQIDLRNNIVLRRFSAPDADPDDRFSLGLAVHAHQAVIGSPRDADLSIRSGAAYRFRSLVGTLPAKTLVSTGNFAPAVPGASFTSFANPIIDPGGKVMFDARLRGPNTTAGRNRGLWSTLGSPTESIGLLLQGRDSLDALGPAFIGTRVVSASGIAMNEKGHALLSATLSGPVTGPGRNQALMSDDGTSLTSIARTGTPIPILGDASLRGIRQAVQNRSIGTPRIAFTYDLRREGTLATPQSDSGLLFANTSFGTLLDPAAREASAAPGTGLYGQFTGRVAISNLTAVFSCFHIKDETTTVPAVFKRTVGGASLLVAEEGVAAPGAGAALFRSFLAEGVNTTTAAVFRATLSGDGVTAANNEGLWHQSVGLVARKGSPVPGFLPNTTWSRFLGFWPVANNGLIFQALIKGPGINASTNTGLWVLQEDGSLLNLLRLGQPLNSSDAARIRSLQRIDVNPTEGSYAILVSLTGSAAHNQALLAGSVALGNPTTQTSLRLPQLKLRKGLPLIEQDGSTLAVRSLSMRTTTDPSGSGAKGLGHALGLQGQIVLSVIGSDRSTRLLSHQEITLQP